MNKDHLENLNKGKDFWNGWREENPEVIPDLKGVSLTEMDSHVRYPLKRRNLAGFNLVKADIGGANLRAVDLSGANLFSANLSYATLTEADLTGANLQIANLYQADLGEAILCKANLFSSMLQYADLTKADCREAMFRCADLGAADLTRANFSSADLREAHLLGTRLVKTNFENADLTGSSVWGVSAWDLKLDGAKQSGLVITPKDAFSSLTVDDLEVAQFLYLLVRNEKLRNVIDNMVNKAVLILGRFTEERLSVLKTVREELRKYNYLPILFDFKPSEQRNLSETVSTVAHLSRFVIADITEPQAIPQELEHIVANLQVPVVLIFQPLVDVQTGKIKNEWGMSWDFRERDHVLPIYDYDSVDQLLSCFKEEVVNPAEQAIKVILEKRRKLNEEKQEIRERRQRKILGQ
jgi:uncharacterized protein YjbI with pentapeptide repeats